MFDEQEKMNNNPEPTNLPVMPTVKEPEDILGDVDNVAAPKNVGGSNYAPVTDEIPDEYINESKGETLKKILKVAAIVLVIGGGAAGAYYWYSTREVKEPSLGEIVNEGITEDANNPEVIPLEQPISAEADQDGDGLMEAREIAEGTDPNNPDTDGDGLFDGEEIAAFGTDPLNRDTDNDGFIDGAEVRNGYNPRGEGRLFSVPQ